MKVAFKYYGQIHRDYLWLHAIFIVILMITSVFWFILPLFIFSYGNYIPSFPVQLVLMMFLFIFPSIIVTLHCWVISFHAAVKWQKQHPGENLWKWLLRFQSMAFGVVIVFSTIIYSAILLIDTIR